MDDLPDISSFLSKYKERIQSQQEDIRRLKTELAEAVKERDSFKTSCERSFLMNRESIERLLTKLELMVDSSRIFEGKEQQRAKMSEGVGTIVDVVQQMQQQPPQPTTEMSGLVMPMSPLAATAESSALTLSLSSPSASLLEGRKPEHEPEPEQMTEHVEEVHITESKKKRRGGKKKKKYEEEAMDEFGQMMEMQEEEVVVAAPPPSSPLRVGSPSQPEMLEIERRTIAVTGNPTIGEGAGQSETLDEYLNAAFAKMGTGLEGERSVSPGVTVYPESPRVVSLTKVTTNVPALAKALEQRQSSSGSEEKAARLLIESKKEKQQERGGGSSSSSSPRIEELTGAELAAAEGSPRITPQMVIPAAEQASNPWQVVAPNILETIVSGLELKDVTGEAFV